VLALGGHGTVAELVHTVKVAVGIELHDAQVLLWWVRFFGLKGGGIGQLLSLKQLRDASLGEREIQGAHRVCFVQAPGW
jgi:hypothetical protein